MSEDRRRLPLTQGVLRDSVRTWPRSLILVGLLGFREAQGPAYTGLSNARPETLALSRPPADLKKLPFKPLEFIEQLDELPFDPEGELDIQR